MSESLSSSWDVDSPGGNQAQRPVPRNRRRDKVQLSCNLCRRRKLKCDRNQPCETCSNKGLSLSCSYGQVNSPGNGVHNRTPLPNIEGRINQLEELVVSLRSKASSPGARRIVEYSTDETELTDPSHQSCREQTIMDFSEGPQAPLSDVFGRISLGNHEASHVSGAHWTAILDGIAELKNHFEDDHEPSPLDSEIELRPPPTEKPVLLFGANKYATKQDILASIPSRPIVDRLVSGFFSAMDMAPVVIHGPTFLKEYERFWINPLAAPVMWIGMLFAMMCLATQFQTCQTNELNESSTHSGSAQEYHDLLRLYQEKIVQCLVLGKYTRKVPYTMQTLLLYFTTEHFQSEDTQLSTWILLGVIVRIAMRMGYHCDASHSTQITPFQGEMRRRVWAILVQLDLGTSSQIGLPRMIKESESDTAEPRNLFDRDFDETVAELPVSRPDSDLTPMLYVIAKNRVMAVLGKISDLVTSTRPTSYEEVMKLDKVIDEVRSAVPPSLEARPMAKSLLDSPEIVMQRMYLELLLHKVRCILHRKYLIPAHSNSRYGRSRQACIDAALNMLQIQSTLHQETQPRGRLYQNRWKLSSLVNHDFLLAATILCVDIDQTMAKTPRPKLNSDPKDQDQSGVIMEALHESYRIWLQSSRSSREAQKAARALKIMLAVDRYTQTAETNGEDYAAPRNNMLDVESHPSTAGSPNSQLMSTQFRNHGMLPSQVNRQSPAPVSSSMPLSSLVDFASSDNLGDRLIDFDWDKWDSETLGQGFENDEEFGQAYFDNCLQAQDVDGTKGLHR